MIDEDLQRKLASLEYERTLKSTLKYLNTEATIKLLKILYCSLGGNI